MHKADKREEVSQNITLKELNKKIEEAEYQLTLSMDYNVAEDVIGYWKVVIKNYKAVRAMVRQINTVEVNNG